MAPSHLQRSKILSQNRRLVINLRSISNNFSPLGEKFLHLFFRDLDTIESYRQCKEIIP